MWRISLAIAFFWAASSIAADVHEQDDDRSALLDFGSPAVAQLQADVDALKLRLLHMEVAVLHDRIQSLAARSLSQDSNKRTPDPNLIQGNPFLSGQPGYPSWSAFEGIRWHGETPVVQINGGWYTLATFHGIPTPDISQFCGQRKCASRRTWYKSRG